MSQPSFSSYCCCWLGDGPCFKGIDWWGQWQYCHYCSWYWYWSFSVLTFVAVAAAAAAAVVVVVVDIDGDDTGVVDWHDVYNGYI